MQKFSQGSHFEVVPELSAVSCFYGIGAVQVLTGPAAHRGVRHSQEDECPVANWSDLTRDNVSSSTGASLVRKL